MVGVGNTRRNLVDYAHLMAGVNVSYILGPFRNSAKFCILAAYFIGEFKTDMPVLPLVIHPDPILRLPTEPVTEFNDGLRSLLESMFETMDHDRGVGLAAPQIGILRKIIVVSYKRRRLALINPEIKSQAGIEWGEEGCLSIPHLRLMVPRSKRVEVVGQTPSGKHIVLKEHGFVARILQHEIDHLNGILILDKGTPIPDDHR